MRFAMWAFAVILVAHAQALGQSGSPKDIIDRAIKAQAPKPEDLAKRRVERVTMEGKISFGGEVPIVREIIAEWPSRVRYNNTLKNPQGENRINFALNADRGWKWTADSGLEEFTFNQVDEFRAEAHGRWLATLYPLKDAALTLTPLPEIRVDDEEAQVVKASARFRPDVLLFFSKKTGLLRKASYKTTEGGVPVRKEHIFSDYKKFDGLLLPGKEVDMQNGNKMAEFTIKEYKFLDKPPEGVFEKPK